MNFVLVKNNYLILWVRAWHSDTKDTVKYVGNYQQDCKQFSDPGSSYSLMTLFSTLQFSTETTHKLETFLMKATILLNEMCENKILYFPKTTL